jgi:hypothetical protein
VTKGNVVKSWSVGEMKLKICDDYCRDKTVEQGQEIIDQIARTAYPVLRQMHEEQLQREGTA